MAEQDGNPKIEVAGANMSGKDLRRRAEELKAADKVRPSAPSVSEEVKRGMEEATAPLVKAIENLVPVAGVDALADVAREVVDLKNTLTKKEPEEDKDEKKEKREELVTPMSWKEASDILEKHADRVAQSKVTSNKDKDKVEDAILARDGLVQQAKDKDILNRSLKEKIATAMDEIVSDYPVNLASGRSEDPRSLIRDRLRALVIEPEGELEGILQSYIDGVTREIDVRVIEGQMAARSALKMGDNPALVRERNEIQARISILNWGGLSEDTKNRLQRLSSVCVDWQMQFGPEHDDYLVAAGSLAKASGDSFNGDGLFGFEFRARSIGFSKEDMELLRMASKDTAADWLENRMGDLEDAAEAVAQEITSHIKFGLDYIRDKNENGKLMYKELSEAWNDRLLFNRFFAAFDEAGKEDFAKATAGLRNLARPVFESKSGAERMTRLWGKAFPVIWELEKDLKLIEKLIHSNAEGKVPIDEEAAVMKTLAGRLGYGDGDSAIGKVGFALRVWRALGRRGLYDAYMPKDIETENVGKTWETIQGHMSMEKKLCMLMNYPAWGKKYSLGLNPYFWGECVDVGLRDFFSNMFTFEELKDLGLQRRDGFIVPSLAMGNQEKLANLDFTKLSSGGSKYIDWLGVAEHAGNTVGMLNDWIKSPSRETLSKIAGAGFLHWFTTPGLGDLVAREEPENLIAYTQQKNDLAEFKYTNDSVVDPKLAEICGKGKWYKYFLVAQQTVRFRTPEYQANPSMIVRDWEKLRSVAENLIVDPNPGSEWREKQLAMVELIVPKYKANLAKVNTAVQNGAASLAQSLLKTLMGGK